MRTTNANIEIHIGNTLCLVDIYQRTDSGTDSRTVEEDKAVSDVTAGVDRHVRVGYHICDTHL